MKIIVDGPDGAGKTTLVRQLADHFGCDILHMTEKGSKKIEDYRAKAILDNVISDRSFMSEIVYSLTFNRESALTMKDFEELVKWYRHNGWVILVLTADKTTLTERLIARGDEDEKKIQQVSDLNAFYLATACWHGLPIIKSETLNVNQLIQDLEEGKYGQNNR